MKQRKVALAKGRLADKAIALFEKAGYDVSGLVEDSRMLIFENKELSFLMVKPTDVPVYVEHGVADFGICGKDTLLESGAHIYETMDAAMANASCLWPVSRARIPDSPACKVATKQDTLCQGSSFENGGRQWKIIPLYGAVELGPITGLSDIDLGYRSKAVKRLRKMGSSYWEEIAPISARLERSSLVCQLKTKCAVYAAVYH